MTCWSWLSGARARSGVRQVLTKASSRRRTVDCGRAGMGPLLMRNTFRPNRGLRVTVGMAYAIMY